MGILSNAKAASIDAVRRSARTRASWMNKAAPIASHNADAVTRSYSTTSDGSWPFGSPTEAPRQVSDAKWASLCLA
jgi:hypothetical protein